ncbi:MAG: hypothetical protein ACI92I_000283 [Acidimicrobiales bacterium]|jgi:hypothetical protein
MYFVTLFILIGLSVTQIVLAAPNEFVPLVGIPYLVVPQGEELGLGNYINALYKISISVAAFLAVVKIIFAGVKYMISDIVPTKEQAKKDIRGALLGLLIVIGAVLILTTINPQLTGLDALQKIPGFSVKTGAHEGRSADQIRIEEMCKSTFGCSKDVCGFVDDSIYDTCKEDCENDKNGVFTPSLLPGGVCTYVGNERENSGDDLELRFLGTISEDKCVGTDEGKIYTLATAGEVTSSCMSTDEIARQIELDSGAPIVFSILPITRAVDTHTRERSIFSTGLDDLEVDNMVGLLRLDSSSEQGKKMLEDKGGRSQFIEDVLQPACGEVSEGYKIIDYNTNERVGYDNHRIIHFYCIKE